MLTLLFMVIHALSAIVSRCTVLLAANVYPGGVGGSIALPRRHHRSGRVYNHMRQHHNNWNEKVKFGPHNWHSCQWVRASSAQDNNHFWAFWESMASLNRDASLIACTNVDSTLAQRRRRWASVEPVVLQYLFTARPATRDNMTQGWCTPSETRATKHPSRPRGT